MHAHNAPDDPGHDIVLHLIIIAWLYVTFAMALTSPGLLSGMALFLGIGIAPVALLMWLAVRRHRAERARAREQRDIEPKA